MKTLFFAPLSLLLLAPAGSGSQIREVDVIYPPVMIGPAKVPPAPMVPDSGPAVTSAGNVQGRQQRGRGVIALELDDCVDSSAQAGYSFALQSVVSCEDTMVDMYLSYTPKDGHYLLVPDDTDIKDLGIQPSVTRVPGFSLKGWEPSHGVPLIAGHAYVVWTSGGDLCLIRVLVLREKHASFEWVWHSNLSRTRAAAAEKKKEEEVQRRKDLGPYFGR
jgi:hypothetical protein